ncbi:hypothetical protein OSB04_003901 [Centaurea solstitialis]|uniref:BURP domain-containing protein n=1 Tax=Centaurea solstitialis TaxID=347529 RepID=A0AA38WU09_9ASTR|nr:hypothetical protein OSB04_003901 [Centaurea solstitialis]
MSYRHVTWSPGHGAFVALGSGPGRIEVCHWIFENDMTLDHKGLLMIKIVLGSATHKPTTLELAKSAQHQIRASIIEVLPEVLLEVYTRTFTVGQRFLSGNGGAYTTYPLGVLEEDATKGDINNDTNTVNCDDQKAVWMNDRKTRNVQTDDPNDESDCFTVWEWGGLGRGPQSPSPSPSPHRHPRPFPIPTGEFNHISIPVPNG